MCFWNTEACTSILLDPKNTILNIENVFFARWGREVDTRQVVEVEVDKQYWQMGQRAGLEIAG